MKGNSQSYPENELSETISFIPAKQKHTYYYNTYLFALRLYSHAIFAQRVIMAAVEQASA